MATLPADPSSRPTPAAGPAAGDYVLGAGVYDITGPAGGVVMMGFMFPEQKTSGIHLRLRARAFIVGDASRRVVFVSADLGMMFQMVKLKVAERLAGDPELSKYYDERNVLLSATHTHGGPGGYSGYFLYDVTVGGFIRRHFDTIVDGIYRAIARAHRNLRPGRILVNEGTLEGVGGNRAVEPYENNPAEERAGYAGDTDRTFTLLKLVATDGEAIGMISWFGVHPDSVGPKNTLITSDNKGLASYLFEKDKGTDYLAERTFVAAFAQGSQGDVTPNAGFGQAPPGVTFETNPSLANATLRQYEKAKELYDGAVEPRTGSIDFRHEWVDMRTLYVERAGSTTVAAGMGASFSAGSPLDNDSPVRLFPNGMTTDRVSWRGDKRAALKRLLLTGAMTIRWPASADPEYRRLHAEKPVLLPTGIARMIPGGPTMTPQIMPLQILKIGTLAIIAVPSEVTTMSGRRFKRAVLAELAGTGVEHAVVAGLSNSYSSYLATREEYAKQWFEGASTQFGPHQQAGFEQEYVKLCRAIADGRDVSPGPTPEDVTRRTVDLTARVWLDAVPHNKRFGDVVEPTKSSYAPGDEVRVSFWGGHPNNDYRIQDTFLAVERLEGDAFVPVARDWDPEATYRWRRDGLARSKITITWSTKGAAPGTYRIRHFGHRKVRGRIEPYEGISREFRLCARQAPWQAHPRAWRDSGGYFECNGRQLFCRTAGEGEALLLLHGFPTSSWDWRGVWEPLSRSYRVLGFDYLGSGFSDKPADGRYGVLEYADEAERLLEAQGIRRVHLLAHDLGGLVAQELVARLRDRSSAKRTGGPEIQSVFLLECGLLAQRRRPGVVQRLLSGPLGSLFRRLVNKAYFRSRLLAAFGRNTRPHQDEIDAWWDGCKGAAAIYHKLLGHVKERRALSDRWIGALLGCPVPLGIARGLEDPAGEPTTVGRLMELRPETMVYDLPGVGHYPQTEAPDRLLAAYSSFRTSAPAVRSSQREAPGPSGSTPARQQAVQARSS